ncbi:MAG TPA: lysylphosphatidylglycerol synthase transmembrane domain-containing protein [Polyangia bacterium]|jgi:uncharacterized protein (TIRG00374 family)
MSQAGTPPANATWRRRLVPILRWLVIVAALLLLVRFVQRADLDRAWALLRRLGWPVALVVLPTLAAMMLDARGWQAILRTLGHPLPWRRLLGLRLSVEAFVLALPGGSVAGEAAKLALMRRGGVPVPDAAASLALTKLLLLATDAAYLAVVGTWLSIAVAAGLPAARFPILLCFAGAALTAVAATVLWLVLRRSTAAAGIVGRLSRFPVRFVACWFRRRRAQAEALDDATARHFAAPARARLAAVVAFALEWLCEGLETLLIFYCLGVPIGFGQALAVDGLGSLLRVLVFFVPAGLGIQDAAQVMLLGGLGVHDPVAGGTAFVVVKRTKEIFWIAIGLLLFAGKRDSWLRAALADRRSSISLTKREGDAAC